jgi:hypothetical protein
LTVNHIDVEDGMGRVDNVERASFKRQVGDVRFDGTFVPLSAAAASDSPADDKSPVLCVLHRSARNTGVPPQPSSARQVTLYNLSLAGWWATGASATRVALPSVPDAALTGDP